MTVSKVDRRESKRRQSEQEVSELICIDRTAWVSEQELQRSTGAGLNKRVTLSRIDTGAIQFRSVKTWSAAEFAHENNVRTSSTRTATGSTALELRATDQCNTRAKRKHSAHSL